MSGEDTPSIDEESEWLAFKSQYHAPDNLKQAWMNGFLRAATHYGRIATKLQDELIDSNNEKIDLLTKLDKMLQERKQP